MDHRGPVIQGALLRRRLAELRRQRGLTQDEVAEHLEWHTSKLIRIEGGRTGISKVDLDALGRLYEVDDPAVMEELHSLGRGARAKAWWSEFKNDLSDAYLKYIGFEAGAAVIKQFQPLAVPGLLQTEDYAASLVCAAMGESVLERLVKVRVRRQQALMCRASPPQEVFVLDEAVIRRHVGIGRDRAIMPAQLRHMVSMATENENISIRVIPFHAGSHVGMVRGAFTLLEFENGLGSLVHLENGDIHETITGEDPRISDVQADFQLLLEEALGAAESLSFITRAAVRMEQNAG